MIFNMSGGGGSDLNFSVVGSPTQPVAPKYNDIWVKTSVKIPDWEFSEVNMPSHAMSEGFVYFTSTYNGAWAARESTGLNFLRKHAILTKLTAACQYYSGAWHSMDAYIYKSGTWVQFSSTRLYMYKNGDPCNTNTGGWRSDNGSSWLATGTYNINDNGNIYLKGNNSGLWVHTVNTIDLTGYRTLSANISYAKGKRNLLSVFTPTTAWNMDGDVSRTEISASGIVTLDVSALTGSHFIGVGTHSSETGLAEMKVSEVWLS